MEGRFAGVKGYASINAGHRGFSGSGGLKWFGLNGEIMGHLSAYSNAGSWLQAAVRATVRLRPNYDEFTCLVSGRSQRMGGCRWEKLDRAGVKL